mmetsp:Transcript_22095/g.32197  ORF Transcript_22095/g.32197 Transcript_22095/m.32197 type:complete len:208 (+) Transcript_22095:73-696(+)
MFTISRARKRAIHVAPSTYRRSCGRLREDHSVMSKYVENILQQKVRLLDTVTDIDYSRSHNAFFGSSIGGHIRHSLDHYTKLFTCVENISTDKSSIVHYDSRNRQTPVENNRLVAIEVIHDTIQRLRFILQRSSLESQVKVEFVGDPVKGHVFIADSTIARELAFVAHHGTHHLSTVKLMMERMGYSVSDDVGVAPSTANFKSKHNA